MLTFVLDLFIKFEIYCSGVASRMNIGGIDTTVQPVSTFPQTDLFSVFSIAVHYSFIFHCRCREIQANLTATAVKNIPDSLRELAQQNRVMKRELLLHQDSIYETEQEIEEIKEDIR